MLNFFINVFVSTMSDLPLVHHLVHPLLISDPWLPIEHPFYDLGF